MQELAGCIVPQVWRRLYTKMIHTNPVYFGCQTAIKESGCRQPPTSQTTHGMHAYAEPELKQAYIDLCLQRGGTYIVPNTTTLHDGPLLCEYRHYNVTVRTVPGACPRVVLDAYWTSKTPANIAHCVTILERRLKLDKAWARKQRTRGVQKPTRAA